MKCIDLHVHSTASDGSFTPSELVDYAIKKDICAFALTDHDTCDGIISALDYCQTQDISPECFQLIPGIELSTEYNGKDIHILGLNIDYHNIELQKSIDLFQSLRTSRNSKMIKKLNDLNFHITDDMIKKRFGNAVITRAHYAILLIECGYVKDKETAFNQYLNEGCPCYVPRFKITPEDAVKLIIKAHGHPVLAHPVLYNLNDEDLSVLLTSLKACGLEGIEAIYPCNKENDEDKYKELAHQYSLYITGGSDFHGTAKPGLELGSGYDNNIFVPTALLENIL